MQKVKLAVNPGGFLELSGLGAFDSAKSAQRIIASFISGESFGC